MVAEEASEQMSHVAVIHYTGATARSFSVVASLVADLRDAGSDVVVVDLEPTTTIRQGFPPAPLARLCGQMVRTDAFPRTLRSLGAKLELLRLVKANREIPEIYAEPLRVAVESELLTYFRLDHIPATREAESLRSSLNFHATLTYWSLHDLWTATCPEEVLVPNGRTSRQKAARLVAEELNIPVRLYENGRAQRNSYYVGTTQPHDRVASQAEVPSLTSKLSDREIHTLAQNWLDSRMSGSEGTNSFSMSWDAWEAPRKSPGAGGSAVFFASSFDEFLAFGPMWSIDEWSSQFEAFDMIMAILEQRGVSLTLRLHPNLASKSRKYFLREVGEILRLKAGHPSLKIYWHNSSKNSYQLVAESDYVIVERSTIGLEASLLGKPVWVTQASQWDQVADIRQLLRPSDITPEALTPWEASPSGAQRFVAYWMSQERPLRYQAKEWATWDPENAPLAMKLLHLTLRNSWSHKARLLRLEWSKIRNNRFRPPSTGRQED